MTTAAKRRSAFEILSDLPPVVDLRDIRIGAGTTHELAIAAAYRWKKAGYLAPFAEEVYFNVAGHRAGPRTHLIEAVEKAQHMPFMMIGLSALHQAGWTTQRPAKPELAVATNSSIRTWRRMEGVTAEGRGVRWFQPAWENSYEGTGGFRYLAAEYALVDAIIAREKFASLDRSERKLAASRNAVIWHPDPDDISVPDDTDGAALAAAVIALGGDKDALRSYLNDIDGFEAVSAGFDECFDDRGGPAL
jgi:hypothetical protein